jgi:hypothetical protein
VQVQIRFRIVTDDETMLCDDVIACFDGADRQPEGIGLSLNQGEDRADQYLGNPLRLRQRVSRRGIGAARYMVGPYGAKLPHSIPFQQMTSQCSAPRGRPQSRNSLSWETSNAE